MFFYWYQAHAWTGARPPYYRIPEMKPAAPLPSAFTVLSQTSNDFFVFFRGAKFALDDDVRGQLLALVEVQNRQSGLHQLGRSLKQKFNSSTVVPFRADIR